MSTLLRDGKTVEDPRLDRLVQFDDRSKLFPIRALLNAQGVTKRRGYTWGGYPLLDQGYTSGCTGFSRAMEAAARPGIISGITNEHALAIYAEARRIDEFPGEEDDGSSVLAAQKAAVGRGWYGEKPLYNWAFGEDDMALAVGYHGPVVVGTWWYDGMYQADEEGYLRPTGRKVGGHAYMVPQYSTRRDGYWIPNSWGGQGQGWIHREDMAKLLADDGECCINTVRVKGLA